MSDARLRELERVAAQGDPEAVLVFLIALGRAGDLDRQAVVIGSYICKGLTRVEALLVAGWGFPAGNAQKAYERLKGDIASAIPHAVELNCCWPPRNLWTLVHGELIERCRERCREEWLSPLQAWGVLKSSVRVKKALAVKRMPRGVKIERERLRGRTDNRRQMETVAASCGPEYLRARLRARREIESFEGACGALELAVMEHELALQEEDRKHET